MDRFGLLGLVGTDNYLFCLDSEGGGRNVPSGGILGKAKATKFHALDVGFGNFWSFNCYRFYRGLVVARLGRQRRYRYIAGSNWNYHHGEGDF